jgi:hypothetical protein
METAAPAPMSTGLVIGDHDSAVRCAVSGKGSDMIIGGIDGRKIVNLVFPWI